jgi:aryl-phospho-beta-D-glucosidase BglC (GH1 family)
MIKKRFANFSLFITLVFALFQIYAKAQFLAVHGKKIINTANNKEVILNAMNFGNWMVMEGYMMNSTKQAPNQHTWKKKLTSLIGSSNTAAFYNAWLTNHVTPSDIIQLKIWGFNSVRLPIHYEYFVNSGTPDVWNNQGFEILDNIISWCRNAEIYVIIDLHAAPGGQSNNAISDYDNTKPSLWESAANKTKTVNLWKKLSERYKNEAWVAGYDLLNEPAWDLPNGTDLRNLYGRITEAIRANADNHILFIEGNWYSNDYTGLTPAWDANMVYVFHKYWSNATSEDIKWITDFRNNQNRPIWCGEHGENSNDHFTKTVETFYANGIGLSWWPMKKFESINDFADAKFPAGYNDLLNYFGGSNPTLDPTTAFITLMQLAENVKLSNCIIQDEVLRSIFIQPGNRNTEAFSNNSIPGKLFTPDYDKGMNGYAYSDQAWEDVRLTTGTYTAWNNGWVYRNNGVDIETTFDPISNGYTVGWFSRGEWLKFTVDVTAAGTYTIEFRIANGSPANGTVQIQNADGTEILATSTVPSTGSWSNWTTVSVTGGFRKAGLQGIRIANTLGEYNINSVNFVFQNSTIPVLIPVIPTQKVISLKGNNNKYVTFSGADNLMTCTEARQGSTEEFTVVDAGNGLVALKGSNGNYVSVNGTGNLLYCNVSVIGTNEKFTLTDLCGALSLKGYNNLYVSSDNGATTGMPCSRTTAQNWEYFNWTYIRNELIATGISDLPEANRYKVFPNPAQNSINISSIPSGLNSHTSVIIYDLSGRAVIHTLLTGSQNTIDISNIPDAVYLMRIIESQKSISVKFIKANY